MKKFKSALVKIIMVLYGLLDDFFILAGITVIIKTVYKVNALVGDFLVGIVLLLLGVLLMKRKS